MITHVKKTKTQKSPSEDVNPLLDPNLRAQIEKRAYEIWLSSGCSHGDDFAHWFQAEHEVMAEHQRIPSL